MADSPSPYTWRALVRWTLVGAACVLGVVVLAHVIALLLVVVLVLMILKRPSY